MKLLSKKQIKLSKSKENEQEILRAKKVLDVTNNLRKNLNSFKTFYEDERIKTEKDFEMFLNQINNKRSSLSNEVSILEERKQIALQPLHKEIKEIEIQKTNLKSKELLLDDKQNDFDINMAKFEAKKLIFNKKEKDLVNKNELFDLSKDDFDKDVIQLSVERKEFSKKQKKVSKLQLIREDSIKEHEDDVNTRELILIKKDEYLIIREKSLEKEKELLASRTETLQAAYKEIRNK